MGTAESWPEPLIEGNSPVLPEGVEHGSTSPRPILELATSGKGSLLEIHSAGVS